MSAEKKRKIDIESTASHMMEALNFVDNQFVKFLKDQPTLPNLQPSTGKLLCDVPLSTKAQVLLHNPIGKY